MKTIYYLIFVFAGMVIFSSCTITRQSIPTAPVHVQINLNMDNLEYVGDVVGTSTQSYVLKIPIGGRKYTAGVAAAQSSFVNMSLIHSRGMNNAMFDAMKSKPDADFLMPVSIESKKQQMFLGCRETITIKGKAFKIKTK